SPDEKRTYKYVVESPYIGMIQSKGITQLLLLGALDIIQKRYWRKLRDHVSDIRAVDLILLLRALKLLEKTSARGDRTILLRALRHLENKGKLAIFKGTSARLTTVNTHVTQPKAPTDKRSKKKKNPSSSHLRTFKIIRESSPLTQAIDSQHAEEIMVTADPHQSLDASESAEDQGN
ncbi:hypothetical protein Tco_1012938, partial [Tanacetum coccineum]